MDPQQVLIKRPRVLLRLASSGIPILKILPCLQLAGTEVS